MVARFIFRGSRLALQCGLAVCALCGAWAPQALAQYRAGAGPTLRDLYSVQAYPVSPVSVEPPVPLPAPGSAPEGSGLIPGAPAVAGGFSPDDFLPAFSASNRYLGGQAPAAPAPGGPMSAQIWLPAPGVADSWSMGAKNWRYVSDSGFGVTLGNALSRGPSWSEPVRLAGIGVYRAPFDDQDRASAWQYSMAVGAIDESADSTAESGGLSYGPAASDTFVKYDVAPSLSLTSQMQWMPDLLAVGLGGQYAAGGWGSWVLGVSRAQQALGSGWRYRLGYQVDLPTDLTLSWVNEQRGSGYADLSEYGAAPRTADSVSNQWEVNVPMGRWGALSGTYEQTDTGQGDSTQTFGLAQQFWYSPHVQVRLEANRDIDTGAYGLGLKLTLPLD